MTLLPSWVIMACSRISFTLLYTYMQSGKQMAYRQRVLVSSVISRSFYWRTISVCCECRAVKCVHLKLYKKLCFFIAVSDQNRVCIISQTRFSFIINSALQIQMWEQWDIFGFRNNIKFSEFGCLIYYSSWCHFRYQMYSCFPLLSFFTDFPTDSENCIRIPQMTNIQQDPH